MVELVPSNDSCSGFELWFRIWIRHLVASIFFDIPCDMVTLATPCFLRVKTIPTNQRVLQYVMHWKKILRRSPNIELLKVKGIGVTLNSFYFLVILSSKSFLFICGIGSFMVLFLYSGVACLPT